MTSALLLFARGAVILGFALVAIRLLRRSPATLRYLVLAAALTAVLALPLIEGAIPTWHTGAIASPAVAAPIQAELPLPDLGGAAVATSSVIPTPADVEIPWTSILAGLWFLGCSLALFRVGYGAARARLIAHRGSPGRPGVDVTEVWRSLGGSGRAPRLVSSHDVDGPIVVGAIAPIVVVPRSSTGWSVERWRIVLLHELAHVRQRDGLINLVAQLACCLHWIDPLAWIAARRLREERELAADDAVLRAGARASSYAEHLVELATGHQSTSVLAMAERSRFESRVVALLETDRPRRTGWHRVVAVIAAAALVTVGVACVSPGAAPVSTEASPAAPAPKLATDTALQTFLEQQLDTAIEAHRGTGAVAIVLDAKTGKPLAIASRGDVDARTSRIPGSTVKPFAFAAALEAGTVDTTTKIDCENGVKTYGTHTVRDSSPNATLDLAGILAVSSNVCTAKLVEPLGDQLGQAFRRYRLSAPEHVDTRSFEGAAVAFGEGVAVSPLELASAYTALADGGIHHALTGDGVRVMREDTARTVLGLMEHVVVDSCGTGQAARLAGVRVAGKTGTARSKPGSDRNYASFVGVTPADAPRFVILVGIDGVTTAGGKAAAPVFATIAAHVLR